MTVFVKMYMSMRCFVFMNLKSCCIILVYFLSMAVLFFFFFLSYLLSVVSASKVDFLNFPLQNQTSCEFLV